MNVYIAPGKLIISGEYSVLFGYPAIVMAIDKYIQVKIGDSETFRISLYGKVIKGTYDLVKHEILKISPVTYFTLNKVLEIGVDINNLSIEITSTIPFKGLGSSSALISSLLFGLLDYKGYKMEKEKLLRIAYDIKKKMEGGSPTDLVASIFGGIRYVIYQDTKIYHDELKTKNNFKNELTFYAKYTGERVVTSNILKSVIQDIQSKTYKQEIIRVMGILTKRLKEYIIEDNVENIIRLLRLNHFLLASLGVSSSKIDEVVNLLDKIERMNVVPKISGAGFGDSILIVSRDKQDICNEISNCIRIDIDYAGVRKIANDT